MNTLRFLAVAALGLGVILSAIACGPSGSSGTSQAPAVGSSISAMAASDSAQAQAAESAAAQVADKCLPQGTSVNLWIVELLARSSTRQAFVACEKIPPGDGDKVAACVLTAAEAYHASSDAKAAKQAAFIRDAGTCVNNLGASPAATPTGSPAAAPSAGSPTPKATS